MNLFKALVTVSGMTLLSRVTGFVRDLLTARWFGASVGTDAFFLAFSLPNLLRRLFAEGAFSQAFVPILGEYRNRRGQEETRHLIDCVATVLAWVLVAVTLLGIVAAPAIIWIAAPGFADEPGKFDLTTLMLRIMFPYIGFVSLVALAGGVLNTWSKFSVPAFTPVLLNLSLIGAMWGFSRFFDPPILSLAVGVIVGGVLQLAFQIPALARIGLMPRLRLNVAQAWRDEGVRRVMRQMGPAVLGVSVAQVSLVINRVFQSFLETGSISWLFYADRLMEFPTALLGVALGTVLLPSLSRASARADTVEYAALLDWGLRLTCVLALPAAIALAALSLPLVTTLFHYGRFDAHDVTMVRAALVAYAIGLLGLILVKVLAPGYYARQDIRTPVRIAIGVLVLTQLMNLAFIKPFAHAGLALSISLAACINAGLLYAGIRRRGYYAPRAGWRAFLLRVGIAALLMGLGLWWAANRVDWLALGANPMLRAAWLVALIAAGGALYVGLLFALGLRLKDVRRSA
ncbi:MAG TPA: murein biosynthesis integral membrane protein MurJ [Burkholderiaceae bacterium]|nr:murein biosynthesis integral membrane protein MurJ [Burkholderiaceae bacterium]